MKTEKLFLTNPFLSSCDAKVIALDEVKSAVALDKTVAYAISGGQESDHGWISVNRVQVPYEQVVKQPGRNIFLADFPSITVDNLIWITVPIEQFNLFHVDLPVKISIDCVRRAELTQAHTGLHIALMAGEELGLLSRSVIKGCSIATKKGRLDFFVEQKLQESQIKAIETKANEIVKYWGEIKTFPDATEPEAYYWQLDNYRISCGGTHLTNAGLTGRIEIRKKNLGANMQRIEAVFPDSVEIFTSMYHSK